LKVPNSCPKVGINTNISKVHQEPIIGLAAVLHMAGPNSWKLGRLTNLIFGESYASKLEMLG
jgi:hypothetical protein